MLCSEEVARMGQLGNTTTTLCSQGVVLVSDLNKAASKLKKATQASDLAYLYMFDKHEPKHSAVQIAHRVYTEAAVEWTKHRVICRGCRGAFRQPSL